MKETELNKVLNYMKQYVENKYEHDSEPMLTYKDLQLVLDEIDRLHSIIKEIRETIKDKRETMISKLLSGGRCNYEELLYQLDEEICKILDKVEENK